MGTSELGERLASRNTTLEWQCTVNKAHVPLNSPSCERTQLALKVFSMCSKKVAHLCAGGEIGIALVVRAHSRSDHYPAATALNASRAAAIVAATSFLPCAVLKNAASNCEGGSHTPWLSIALWKRPKAAVSLCAA